MARERVLSRENTVSKSEGSDDGVSSVRWLTLVGTGGGMCDLFVAVAVVLFFERKMVGSGREEEGWAREAGLNETRRQSALVLLRPPATASTPSYRSCHVWDTTYHVFLAPQLPARRPTVENEGGAAHLENRIPDLAQGQGTRRSQRRDSGWIRGGTREE